MVIRFVHLLFDDYAPLVMRVIWLKACMQMTGAAAQGHSSATYDIGRAAILEIIELRQENELLHARLSCLTERDQLHRKLQHTGLRSSTAELPRATWPSAYQVGSRSSTFAPGMSQMPRQSGVLVSSCPSRMPSPYSGPSKRSGVLAQPIQETQARSTASKRVDPYLQPRSPALLANRPTHSKGCMISGQPSSTLKISSNNKTHTPAEFARWQAPSIQYAAPERPFTVGSGITHDRGAHMHTGPILLSTTGHLVGGQALLSQMHDAGVEDLRRVDVARQLQQLHTLLTEHELAAQNMNSTDHDEKVGCEKM